MLIKGIDYQVGDVVKVVGIVLNANTIPAGQRSPYSPIGTNLEPSDKLFIIEAIQDIQSDGYSNWDFKDFEGNRYRREFDIYYWNESEQVAGRAFPFEQVSTLDQRENQELQVGDRVMIVDAQIPSDIGKINIISPKSEEAPRHYYTIVNEEYPSGISYHKRKLLKLSPENHLTVENFEQVLTPGTHIKFRQDIRGEGSFYVREGVEYIVDEVNDPFLAVRTEEDMRENYVDLRITQPILDAIEIVSPENASDELKVGDRVKVVDGSVYDSEEGSVVELPSIPGDYWCIVELNLDTGKRRVEFRISELQKLPSNDLQVGDRVKINAEHFTDPAVRQDITSAEIIDIRQDGKVEVRAKYQDGESDRYLFDREELEKINQPTITPQNVRQYLKVGTVIQYSKDKAEIVRFTDTSKDYVTEVALEYLPTGEIYTTPLFHSEFNDFWKIISQPSNDVRFQVKDVVDYEGNAGIIQSINNGIYKILMAQGELVGNVISASKNELKKSKKQTPIVEDACINKFLNLRVGDSVTFAKDIDSAYIEFKARKVYKIAKICFVYRNGKFMMYRFGFAGVTENLNLSTDELELIKPVKTVMTSDDLEELPDDPTDQEMRFKKLDLDETYQRAKKIVDKIFLNESPRRGMGDIEVVDKGDYTIGTETKNGIVVRKEIKNKQGQYHKVNDPAVYRYYPDGSVSSIQYWINGERHSDHGPALFMYHPNGKIKFKIFYQHNQKHREKGPAVIEYDQNGNIVKTENWIKDELIS